MNMPQTICLAPSLPVMGPSMENIDLTVETIVLDWDKLMEWVADQVGIIWASNLEPDFLLMGTEEFSQITRTTYKHEAKSFYYRDAFIQWKDRRIQGIEVRVAPNITGMCVVPKCR